MINFVRVLKTNLQEKEAPKKTYAQAQSRTSIDVMGLAKHMAKHNSSFSRGTIAGIINDAVDHIRELLLDGFIVHLGELGTFNITLESNGVCESVPDEETGEKPVFTAANIKAVNTKWIPGTAFADMIRDAEFHEVAATNDTTENLVVKRKLIAAGLYQVKAEDMTEEQKKAYDDIVNGK